MRSDSVGLFWDDTPPPAPPKKEKPKPVPPEPLWESPDYLPHYDRAIKYQPRCMNGMEIWANAGKRLEFDIECYVNYAMFGFYCEEVDLYILFEKIPDQGVDMDLELFHWVLHNYEIQTFNGNHYDLPISAYALKGATTSQLKEMTNRIIQEDLKSVELYREYKLKRLEINHVDLMNVAPGQASLKVYAGSMMARLMQDLPFRHDTRLTGKQISVLRWYHGNDLSHTKMMRKQLSKQMDLRIKMGAEYGLDLRSRSDAQIAEAVFKHELKKELGYHPSKMKVTPGTAYTFLPAKWLKFETPTMQYVFETIKNTRFVVSETGHIGLPKHLEELKIPIGYSKYQLGIGGLHSTEKRTSHFATNGWLLSDNDVESFYPMLMLLMGIGPTQHLQAFLRVFKTIVDRRIQGKRAGNKIIADTLKIVINGTYGKMGEKHSVIYRPDGIIQICLNGQLTLLMLIERLEMAGIHVVSANTDGIVVKPHETQYELMKSILEQWRNETSLRTEETRYKSLLSRDVNNYVALKDDGGWKGKGEYANFWHPESIDLNEQLKHKPKRLVCQEALIAFLTKGYPIDQFINECDDVTKFITVQTVNGGAWKNGDYLGKAIRTYYSTKDDLPILNAKNGYTVGSSAGAQPLMEMSPTLGLPPDLDKQWYIDRTFKTLEEIGYV